MIAIEWVDEDGSVRRIEAYPQLKATLRIRQPGRASRSTSLGLLTLPRARMAALPWLARGMGMGQPSPNR